MQLRERPSGLAVPQVESRGLSMFHAARREALKAFSTELRVAQLDLAEGSGPKPLIYFPHLSVGVSTVETRPAVREFDIAAHPSWKTLSGYLTMQTSFRAQALQEVGGFTLDEEGVVQDDAIEYSLQGKGVFVQQSPKVPGLWLCRVVDPFAKPSAEKAALVYENITMIDPSKTPQDY